MKRPDLSGYVPSEKRFKSYIPRALEGGILDTEVIVRAIKTGKNVLIEGPPGEGKSHAYDAVCAKNGPLGPEGAPIKVVNGNGMVTNEDLVGQVTPQIVDVGDIRGLHEQIAELRVQEALLARKHSTSDEELGAIMHQRVLAELDLDERRALRQSMMLDWVNGVIYDFMLGDPNYEYSVLVFEELNLTQARILGRIHSATDDRRFITVTEHKGEVVTAHKGYHFAASMNPNLEGTRPLNQALRERFAVQIEYAPDPNHHKKIIKDEALLRISARLATGRAVDVDGTGHLSTRAMLHFLELKETYGDHMPFVYHCLINRFPDADKTALLHVVQAEYSRAGATSTGTTPSP